MKHTIISMLATSLIVDGLGRLPVAALLHLLAAAVALLAHDWLWAVYVALGLWEFRVERASRGQASRIEPDDAG